MNKETVLSTLEELHIPKDAYIVTMGAVLAVNNQRKAGDIDVIYDPRIEPFLKERGFIFSPKSKDEKYKTRYVLDDIEAFPCFFNIGTFAECLKTYSREFVEGIPFMTLEDTLYVKSLFNREKDIVDCGVMVG